MGGKKTTVVNMPSIDPAEVARQQLAAAQPIIESSKKRILELDLPDLLKSLGESFARRGMLGSGFQVKKQAEINQNVLDQLARLSQAKTEATATASSNALFQNMANALAGDQMAAQQSVLETTAFQNAIGNLASSLGQSLPIYTSTSPNRIGNSLRGSPVGSRNTY